MKIWNRLSVLARYYLISFLNLSVCSAILLIIDVEFINIIFFLTAFIWHFALQTPGLKDKVMTNHHKLSFLAVVVRLNHYLQIFINLKKVPYASSFIRALSPAMFTFLLFILGGAGNILFTLAGSIAFEVVYLIAKKKEVTSSTL
jgi:hypothetical protein